MLILLLSSLQHGLAYVTKGVGVVVDYTQSWLVGYW